MNDIYERITATILAELESGTAPWVKPWSTTDDPLPCNAISKRAYRGINSLLLGIERDSAGYATNRWMTFNQARQLGAHVRKGERASTVVFFEMKPGKPTDTDDEEQRSFPLIRVFNVFNVAQIDGLAADFHATLPMEPGWDAEAMAENLLAQSGAEIMHGGFQAFYSPQRDRIHLPMRSAFAQSAGYYGTALHELAHWTGHGSRLNRQFGRRFGDDAYAMEELVAEMACAYLCAHCRIDGCLQHAAYVSSWLSVLRRDKRAVVSAAAAAQRAADYVLACGAPQTTENLKEAA